MKIFACGSCGQPVYFHNVRCTSCGSMLGFVPDSLSMEALEPVESGNGSGELRVVGWPDERYRLCANSIEHEACNWVVAVADDDRYCVACRLNRTVPDLGVPRNVDLWRRLQVEKNRLVYALLRLRLPVVSKQQDEERGLAFDFLSAEHPSFKEDSVTIGHADGLITLDLAEADDAVREQVRQQMAEPYRTILGHFRHESGHYYWDRLVRDSRWLEPFRRRFGDERTSYEEALERHYGQGPPDDWAASYVSAYATMHPWEDWAESWAHYLHIVATLETAWQFGLRIDPRVEEAEHLEVDADFDPYVTRDFQRLIEHWLPLTVALNSLNHSMGLGDAYPFVLTSQVVEKLELVHDIIRDAQSG